MPHLNFQINPHYLTLILWTHPTATLKYTLLPTILCNLNHIPTAFLDSNPYLVTSLHLTLIPTALPKFSNSSPLPHPFFDAF